MVRTRAHGGHCCGIFHLFDFSSDLRPELFSEEKQRIDAAIDACNQQKLLCEVVLITDQLKSGGKMTRLAKYLKKKGFVLVSRFKNGNSDNPCHVLHYHPNRRYVGNKGARW